MRNKQADDLTKGFEEIMKREYGVEFVDVTPDRPSPPAEPKRTWKDCPDCQHTVFSDEEHICRVEAEAKCEECGKPTKADDIGFDFGEGRIACKACTEQIEEDWEATKVVLKAEGFNPDKCDFIERTLARKECGTCGKAILADSERVWVCMCDLNRSSPWPPPAESEQPAVADAQGYAREFFARWEHNEFYSAVAYSGYKHATEKQAEIMAQFAIEYAAKQIERQTPAIIERFKQESGFNAIKFNGETAEQILREQGIYVADDGVTVNTQVETLVKALEKIGQCGAGHVCCNVNFHIAQNAIQTVKARRERGEGK